MTHRRTRIIPADTNLFIMVNSDTYYNILDHELFQKNCLLQGLLWSSRGTKEWF